MSGNPRPVETARSVAMRFRLARARSGEAPGRARAAYDEHVRIYVAIRTHDGAAAGAAMHAHLEASRHSVRQLLEGTATEPEDVTARSPGGQESDTP